MKHEWLSDQTKLVSSAMETEQLAEKVGWLFFCSTQKRLEVDETRETNGPPSISLFLSLSLSLSVCVFDGRGRLECEDGMGCLALFLSATCFGTGTR